MAICNGHTRKSPHTTNRNCRHRHQLPKWQQVNRLDATGSREGKRKNATALSPHCNTNSTCFTNTHVICVCVCVCVVSRTLRTHHTSGLCVCRACKHHWQTKPITPERDTRCSQKQPHTRTFTSHNISTKRRERRTRRKKKLPANVCTNRKNQRVNLRTIYDGRTGRVCRSPSGRPLHSANTSSALCCNFVCVVMVAAIGGRWWSSRVRV